MNMTAKTSAKEKAFDKDARAQLTQMVMKLFDEWELTTKQQLTLLGLKGDSRNMLMHYRNKKGMISADQDKLDRVGILLAIYKNLYDLYPGNIDMREAWLHSANKRFEGKSPIDVMLTGMFGMADVMRYLDLQLVT